MIRTGGPFMTSIPCFGGIYDAPSAARYLLAGRMAAEAYPVTSRTLIRWVRSGLATPGLAETAGRELILSFEDLVSLRVIAALRAFSVTWPKIHEAEAYLRKETGHPRPFAREELWTAQSEVLVKLSGMLVAASRHGQVAMDVLQQYLIPVSGLTFADSVASSWEPRELIVIDPKVQFGEPCIKGTRIPAKTVWGYVHSGDSKEMTMDAYGLTESEFEAAWQWGQSVAAA
jgi:uncharacterized protein (DUF433 family)